MEPICTKVEQISIMVKDLDEAIRVFTDEYGIGPWLIANFGTLPGDDAFNNNSVDLQDVRLHGRYVGNYAARIGVCDIGDFQIELLQPLDNKSLFSEYIEEKGIGCQHIAIDSTLPIENMIGRMSKNGYPLSQQAMIDHGKENCCFVDHMELLGVHIELHDRPGGFEKPGIDPEFRQVKKGVKPLFTRVNQLAFVVNDARATAKYLADQYGLGPFLMVNFGDCHDGKEFIPVEDAVVDGTEIGTYGVHMAACNIGGLQIELLEPVGEDDVLAKFLKERGPGLHHICVDMAESYETTVERIHAAGYTKGQTAFIDNQETCTYTDHLDLLGIFIEIQKRGETFELPKVIPEFYPYAPELNH
ncbi:MAG: VOC family protein [Clostridiales bacterium]|nr:VOC family protein [Clostridiales bacterium]MDY3747858.1 VOC family protein [Lachnospiraceae bacterium]